MIKDLMEFGLSDKEAKVYLALLELGMAPAHDIAQATEIKRPTVYVILERLTKQGFVNLAQNDNIQQYIAASPDIFLRLAEKRADRENNLHHHIKNLIPELKGLHKETKSKPKVRIFEGKEGLITAMTEALGTREKMLRAFSTGENILKLMPREIEIWAKRRIELGVRIDAIYVDNKATQALFDIDPYICRVTFVSKKDYPSLVDMMIWDNKVGYLTMEKSNASTIIIESNEISTVMKGVFDMAFEESKRVAKRYEENLCK